MRARGCHPLIGPDADAWASSETPAKTRTPRTYAAALAELLVVAPASPRLRRVVTYGVPRAIGGR